MPRSMTIWLLGSALLAGNALAGAARAANDKPVMGPPEAWVTPLALPAGDKSDEAPIRLLLSDQQVKLEAGRQTVYSDIALRIQTPQGLAAGNLSFPWNPETDLLTVHKLLIHREGKAIDVLASGQTFTVVRREPNLESATLDGVLTANIQPEGLQVGDVLEFAISITSSDPVLKGHVEQFGANWNGLPISRAHLKVQWPSSLAVTLRQTGALPAIKPTRAGGTSMIELSLDDLQPIIPPKLAPARYAMGRLVELTDYKSWADLGALMAPLFADAAKIPAEGPLRTELEKIRAASSDPVKRTEAALALVEDRIRYVALALGAGRLVPATAEETWARRYGDCKAKTALLMALLRELDVAAEPVAVSSRLGNGMDQRLPMVGMFDHVIVRATIAGKVYWLDGTRTGDVSLARLRVPPFEWGLPLVAQNARLVRMMPPPLEQPDNETMIHIDARAGLSQPAPFKIESILRGDEALGTRLSLAAMTADVRDRALRDYWKEQFNFVTVTRTGASYDAATGEERLTMEGTAAMEWKDGWYETDRTGLGYDADFDRMPGPDAAVPFAVDYPSFSRSSETILLPPGFADIASVDKAEVNETIAATEYRRQGRIANNVFTIDKTVRTIAPEFPASEAPAAEKALGALNDKNVYLRRPANYRLTQAEVQAELKTTPTTVEGFLRRGGQLAGLGQYDEARAAFDNALKLDPANEMARLGMALLYMQRGDVAGGNKYLGGIELGQIKIYDLASVRGGLAAQAGDYKMAIAAYTRALELKPDDGPALVNRARIYQAMGNADAALADSAAALRADPRQANVYLLRANIFRAQGMRTEALAEAGAAEAANPDNGYAHVIAARIYARFGQSRDAMAAYDRALAIKPEAYIYVNRAETRPKADLTGRAADIDAALKLQPGMAEATTAKADLLSAQGDLAGAVAVYSQALSKTPDNFDVLGRRGIAYMRAGDTRHAQEDFAAARARATDQMMLNALCWNKATAGIALDAALSECDAALAKEPESPAIIDSRALVLLRLGRTDDAIAAYDQALAKAATLSSSLYGRSIAWSRKGEAAKAKADLAAARLADPDIEDRAEDYGAKAP